MLPKTGRSIRELNIRERQSRDLPILQSPPRNTRDRPRAAIVPQLPPSASRNDLLQLPAPPVARSTVPIWFVWNVRSRSVPGDPQQMPHANSEAYGSSDRHEPWFRSPTRVGPVTQTCGKRHLQSDSRDLRHPLHGDDHRGTVVVFRIRHGNRPSRSRKLTNQARVVKQPSPPLFSGRKKIEAVQPATSVFTGSCDVKAAKAVFSFFPKLVVRIPNCGDVSATRFSDFRRPGRPVELVLHRDGPRKIRVNSWT